MQEKAILLEPISLQQKQGQHTYELPSIERILDYCRKREDFPKYLNNNVKRRRSLIKEFLCPTPASESYPGNPILQEKPRSLSFDGSFPSLPRQEIIRRHSMIEQTAVSTRSYSPDPNPGIKKGSIRPWSVEEDNLLLDAVKKLGPQWTMIAKLIAGRNRRQCKEHWFRVLSKRPSSVSDSPSVKAMDARHGLWSSDEDFLLLKAYEEFGPRWPVIASKVPGRNQRQCEKRFRRIKKSISDDYESDRTIHC